ncbi:uncharacterized protein A4U43_C03F27530 [Asparagus officinalis]|uniref:Uncharacterized protein n=1 Tax=Asparagus officinalis TaxID=4686 RepID=A0A5P1FIE5_ASPOF|nr:uncharacterized protein A4U43_C03F27530 [Asparagus officinalis]
MVLCPESSTFFMAKQKRQPRCSPKREIIYLAAALCQVKNSPSCTQNINVNSQYKTMNPAPGSLCFVISLSLTAYRTSLLDMYKGGNRLYIPFVLKSCLALCKSKAEFFSYVVLYVTQVSENFVRLKSHYIILLFWISMYM